MKESKRMKSIIKNLSIMIYCSSSFIGAFLLQSDPDAYAYCLSHKNSFIAIVWPLAQGKNRLIADIMKKYGNVIYKKEFYFTPHKALYVLKRAHANASIANMKEHVNWYFPQGMYRYPAQIWVLEFKDMAHNLACKYSVRKLFPELQYRSIHINDYHTETVELAKLFFT